MEVMTAVRGKVTNSKTRDLEAGYAIVRNGSPPPGLLMSFLARDSADPESYQIMTLWESREVLEHMRSTTPVPAALALFRSVGVEPEIRILEVPHRIRERRYLWNGSLTDGQCHHLMLPRPVTVS